MRNDVRRYEFQSYAKNGFYNEVNNMLNTNPELIETLLPRELENLSNYNKIKLNNLKLK